ncbi:hypothetical protein ACE6H2_025862 [Prunus campanulata]
MASVERRSHGVRTIPTEKGLGGVRAIIVSEPVAQDREEKRAHMVVLATQGNAPCVAEEGWQIGGHPRRRGARFPTDRDDTKTRVLQIGGFFAGKGDQSETIMASVLNPVRVRSTVKSESKTLTCSKP